MAVAFEGIAAARSAGLEAVYGNFLRGNAADSLFLLGRWQEARSLSMTALEWLPAGVNFLNTLVSLATVEIELSAGEAAGRLLGQTLLELEAVRDAQQAVPLHLASASFALWRGDLADARRAAERGWTLVRETEDWILAARTAATAIEVEAAVGGRGPREARPRVAGIRSRACPRRHPVGGGGGAPPRRRSLPRLTPPRRRVAGDRPCLPATGRRPRRSRDMARGRGRLGRAQDPVRDRPRALARDRGAARLGRGPCRPGRCPHAVARGGRARAAPRCDAAPARAPRARRTCLDRAAAAGRRHCSGTSPEDGSADRAPVAAGPAPAPTHNGGEPPALMLGRRRRPGGTDEARHVRPQRTRA